jgi:hypothetical protein
MKPDKKFKNILLDFVRAVKLPLMAIKGEVWCI